MGSYNHKISDQSKVKYNPVSRELENTDSGLPTVTSSDNGDVLTVVEGVWAKAEPQGGLPAVTSSDEGKFLRVSSSGDWVAEAVPSAETESY